MLEIKKISKRYITGGYKQDALKDVTVTFDKNEFVSILGPSGSGKTTLLNIIGGLDRYDKGDLVINGKSTKKFLDVDWDSYRNNSIGFIFQSYNLITHIDILSNVELCLTLSGVSKSKRRQRAKEVLTKVGLKNHMHKKPNQLSGGQMQRVAIARALVNDPDIILADEPTGALDSKTSKEVMNIIKEISKEKLVILVTHNREIAEFYSTRIIELKDGKILSDSKRKSNKKKKKEEYKIKNTSMNFSTALSLSLTNIYTKKGRTILTAFASSIGIIGIALILSLSNGFDKKIDEFERDTLSTFPITITEQSMTLDKDQAKMMKDEAIQMRDGKVTDSNKISVIDSNNNPLIHTNRIDDDYLSYLENINTDLTNAISYTRVTNLAIFSNNTKKIKKIDTAKYGFKILPKSLGDDKNYYLKNSYELLDGKHPNKYNEILVSLDNNNRLEKSILDMLGIDCKNSEELDYKKVLNKDFKIVLNDDLYYKQGAFYLEKQDMKELYNNKNNITLKIVGVVRPKEGNTEAIMSSTVLENNAITGGFLYKNELVDKIIGINSKSDVSLLQKQSSYNVLTGERFENGNEGKKEKENVLQYLGYSTIPKMIMIYPKNFDTKDELMNYLNEYNNKKENKDKIIATDSAKIFSTLSGNIMDAITIVLIAFSAISLIVSSIMIGVITYISVLERTKEIGILRALGARKKDITRVFNAETFIIGITSGIIGIIIASILIIPTNVIIENLSELENVAKLNPFHVIILIIVSVTLTLLGGFIPSKIASRKDPVESLRTE